MKALHSGSSLNPSEQIGAVIEFRNWINQFKVGGANALPILHEELYNQNAYRRDTAARILIGMPDLATLSTLSDSIVRTGNPRLRESVLKRLWQLVPQTIEIFKHILKTGRQEGVPMIKALFTHPSQITPSIIELIESSKDYSTLQAYLGSISAWREGEFLLFGYMRRSLLDVDELNNSHITDTRILAGFYLGLQGVTDGVEFLKTQASGDHEIQAAHACHYLVLLASPAAIQPIKSLLRSSNPDVVAVAIQAARELGVASLIDDLALVTQRDEYTEYYPVPICDEAVRTLSTIIGGTLAEIEEDYVWGSIPERFTANYKKRVTEQGLALMRSLNPEKRYRSGQPLTLKTLADDLASLDIETVRLAYCNLKSITGEAHNYSLDGDLIDNVDSVIAWKNRATNPEPLMPGGWAYMGKPLFPHL